MKFAFIFPGQGSQSVGMGKEIYENFSDARELLQNASDSLKIDFKHLLFSQNDMLSRSEFTQPAIVLNSLMSYLALRSNLNLTPVFTLGHSLGEFSALAISDAFSFIDAIRIVNLRGKFMQDDCSDKDVSMMVVLGLSDSVVESICDDAVRQGDQIYAANYNCDGQIVVAGIKEHLAKFESVFKDAGAKRVMPLNMSVVSHCPILQNASNRLSKELESVINESFLPVVSNVSAKPYSSKQDALNLLKMQLVSPVLYKQSIESISNDVDIFVEFGSSVLKGINKKITDKPTYSISDLNSLNEFLGAVK